ncbi:MAG: amidohydrolase [Armatimonadota bacterium]|nr:MAG: amidohydrolase [Armatimonadota bacterium]
MPETLLHNVKIYTMDVNQPIADAMVWREETILAVGEREHLSVRYPGAKRVDGGGLYVVPGFNDCHCHILAYGLDLSAANLSPEHAPDIPSLITQLRRWAGEHPDAPWITGSFYDQNRMTERRHPTRYELDQVSAEKPVFIEHTSKHGGVANSAALRIAGITRETPDPPGGTIERDAQGEPTGVLLESAVDLVTRHQPPLSHAQRVRALHLAAQAMAEKGITAAADASTGWGDLQGELAAYTQAVNEGAPLRVTLMILAGALRREGAWIRPQDIRTGCDGVRVGIAKVFSDGALTTRTAALKEPFVDTGTTGMLLHSEEELEEYVMGAHRAGWQIATHAIGDRAIETMLHLYAQALRQYPRADVRHRIEHCMLLDDELIDRLRQLGVVAVLQPEFVARLGDAYRYGLGEERARRLNRVTSLLQAGVPVAFSSDCPVVPGAPLDGIRAAMERKTPLGVVLGESERVDALTAIRLYTKGSAYAVHDEGYTGSLSAGKRADFVVLSRDPAAAPVEEWEDVRVVATVFGGRVVAGRFE